MGRIRSGTRTAAVIVAGVAFAARLAAGPSGRGSADALTPLLEKRLKTGRVEDVVVDIRWPFETGRATARVSGDGVGLWNRQIQFRLPPDEISSLLRSLARSGFGALPGTIGGTPGERKRETGQVTVRIGGVSRTVAQLEGGEQSAALRSVAEDFLKPSASAAASGVRATTFADGFEKLSSGALAPVALQVVVRRTASPASENPGDNWTLRLDGRRATVTGGASGPAATRSLNLSSADFQALLRTLRDAHLESWPRHFAAPRDTAVRIQVLDQVSSVRALPATRASAVSQKAFDRVFAALLALEQRVEKDGMPTR